MALNAVVKVGASGTHTSALDLGTASFPFNVLQSITYTDGTGAAQADRIFTDTRTLTASATEDLDLSGALTNAYGTVLFAKLKCLIVIADATNTNNVNVIRPAANGVPLFLAVSDGIPVRPGGFLAWACGDVTAVAVTAGTGDLVTFTNSAGTTSVTYTVIIIGTSA